jgi:thiol:disulfide interchange protein
MTGRRGESAARLPLSINGSGLIAAIATVTFFVAMGEPVLAQNSGAATAPNATKASVANNNPPAPLPVDTAFPLLASFEKGKISLRVDVLPGHYLYRDRFEFSRDAEKPYPLDKFKQSADAAGKTKNDPHFGAVAVFEAPVMLNVGQTTRPKTKIVVTYQGCSELAGVCYPPVKRSFELSAGDANVAAIETAKPSGLGALFKKNVSQ